jgi:hypothetical protein
MLDVLPIGVIVFPGTGVREIKSGPWGAIPIVAV